jgi:DNA-binding transcriptional ArsR family regulator
MNSTPEPQNIAVGTPLPDLKRLATALGHTTRWKMLKELSAGEPRTIDELAKVSGSSYANAAKHLASLHRAGLVMRGRGRLYQVPKNYLPATGGCAVDYGHCLLRLDAVG